MRCTLRFKAESHVSAEATQRGTSCCCLLLLRVPRNRQRTSTGRITLSTRFATRFLFSSDLWKWATSSNFRYWQRHWTTSATSSTNIDRQVLVVASAKTQPKGQRVDVLHFVSANDRRSISTKSYPFAISIPVLEDRRFEASADFRAENGRLGLSLGSKRESCERGIFRNIARVPSDR